MGNLLPMRPLSLAKPRPERSRMGRQDRKEDGQRCLLALAIFAPFARGPVSLWTPQGPQRSVDKYLSVRKNTASATASRVCREHRLLIRLQAQTSPEAQTKGRPSKSFKSEKPYVFVQFRQEDLTEEISRIHRVGMSLPFQNVHPQEPAFCVVLRPQEYR